MNNLRSPFSNEPRIHFTRMNQHLALFCVVLLLMISGVPTNADQVEMQNGDRYVGKVTSMTADTLVMENEVLGSLKLPRSKVAQITLGTSSTSKTSGTGVPAQTNSIAKVKLPAIPARPQIKPGTNVVEQVQDQFLSNAPPEAKAKYQQLAGGLMSGKVSVADIRVEAKSAADQLRKMKAELGEEGSEEVEAYLEILDSFLNETKSLGTPASKAKAETTNKDE